MHAAPQVSEIIDPSPPEDKRRQGTARGRRRHGSRRPQIGWELARAYRDALGLTLPVDSAWLYRRTWSEPDARYAGVDDNRRITIGRGWIASTYPAGMSTLRRALSGEYGLDLAEQTRVRFILLDLDVGHGFDPAGDERGGCDLEEFLRRQSKGAKAARVRREQRSMRREVAARSKPIVECLRAAFPTADFAVLGTPRGSHVVVLLEEDVSWRRAESIGRGMLEAIGSPAKCEVWPKKSGNRGRTARLPCTGGSRLLAADLEHEAHRRRADDVRALLELRPATIAELTPNRQSTRVDSKLSPPKAPRNPPQTAPARTGELEGDNELRAQLSEQLEGDDFAEALLAALDRGLPDDTSWPVCGKLAFLLRVAAGQSRRACEQAARTFFELPHHRATKCRTEAGRRQLMSQLRSALRYYDRGIDAGRLTPGGLTDSRLWRMVEELLGRRALRQVQPPTDGQRDAKRRAARAKWSKARQHVASLGACTSAEASAGDASETDAGKTATAGTARSTAQQRRRSSTRSKPGSEPTPTAAAGGSCSRCGSSAPLPPERSDEAPVHTCGLRATMHKPTHCPAVAVTPSSSTPSSPGTPKIGRANPPDRAARNASARPRVELDPPALDHAESRPPPSKRRTRKCADPDLERQAQSSGESLADIADSLFAAEEQAPAIGSATRSSRRFPVHSVDGRR
jgi:hypothetical protein